MKQAAEIPLKQKGKNNNVMDRDSLKAKSKKAL